MDHVINDDVFTIGPVRDEILGHGDQLSEWMHARKDGPWILSVDDAETQRAFADIVNQLAGSPYLQAGIDRFLAGADPWLVAKAQVTGARLITHEVKNLEARRKVPIPNVCEPLGVAWENTFEFLRRKAACFR